MFGTVQAGWVSQGLKFGSRTDAQAECHDMRALSKITTGLAMLACIAAPVQRAAATGAVFKIDGDKIAYKTLGSGIPVLLIHGFPLSSGVFNEKQLKFGPNYKIITVDLPGFGLSKTATTAQTEQHYASELLSLLSSLGIKKAVLGGHGMGGQVVLEMLHQQPGIARDLIFFDTDPGPASSQEMSEWPSYAQQAESQGSASIAPSLVPLMVTQKAIDADPRLGTQMTNIISMAQPDGVAGGSNALVNRSDYTSMLSSITVPTLIIEGGADTIYPESISQAMAAAIPNSTLSILPKTAHASMFQAAGLANTAINNWIATLK